MTRFFVFELGQKTGSRDLSCGFRFRIRVLGVGCRARSIQGSGFVLFQFPVSWALFFWYVVFLLPKMKKKGKSIYVIFSNEDSVSKTQLFTYKHFELATTVSLFHAYLQNAYLDRNNPAYLGKGSTCCPVVTQNYHEF